MDNNEIKVHFAVVFILFLDLRISIFRGKNVLSLSNCITSLIELFKVFLDRLMRRDLDVFTLSKVEFENTLPFRA